MTAERALSAYKQRDFSLAAELWKKLAAGGDADAQFHLGVLYKDGIGLPQNSDEAIKWLKKSNAQGHYNAGLILGVLEQSSE